MSPGSYRAEIKLSISMTLYTPSQREFVITCAFQSSRDLVYKAWTDPKHIARWWGPHASENPACEMDVRPGGTYRIVTRGPDGVEYPLKGVYREVVEPERIVCTADTSEHPPQWRELLKKYGGHPAHESLWTVTFEEQGGETLLRIVIHFDSSADRDAMLTMGMAEGWEECLERLEEELVVMEVSTPRRRNA